MKKIYNVESRECQTCGIFFTPDGWAVKQGKGIYCCRECSDKARGDPPAEITCKCGCGRKRFVKANEIKKGNGKFYSVECMSKYKQEHRQWIKCAYPGCTEKFQVMPWQISKGQQMCCVRHRGYNKSQFKNGTEHRKFVEKIKVLCHHCGKTLTRNPNTVKYNIERGREFSFCNAFCRILWHEKTFRGENHPNYNPNKAHYKGFTPKARERCRDFWGRVCFITGILESKNVNPSGVQELLTCHHIDGDKESLLLIPILRSEHNRIEGNIKNKTGNPEEVQKQLIDNLIIRLKDTEYTLDQYITYLRTGIQMQTSFFA